MPWYCYVAGDSGVLMETNGIINSVKKQAVSVPNLNASGRRFSWA